MKRISHDKFLEEAMSRPGVVSELKKLASEFKIYEDLIKARLKLGKTQEEIAKAMHTSVSAIGRLETGAGKINPTLATLRKYAEALGLKLQLKLVK
jgi:predicted transcriptional regulator